MEPKFYFLIKTCAENLIKVRNLMLPYLLPTP